MELTPNQRAMLTKVRTAGGGDLGIALDDSACTYLIAIIVNDLGIIDHFPELPSSIPAFFSPQSPKNLRVSGFNALKLFERLVSIKKDAETYFYCLATLYKSRLKYERILQSQSMPNVDQVGPRGLLQYGTMNTRALNGFIFWRKWMYDIDNRAAQETGYLFEPIIAYAIGGVPYSAQRSPIKRDGSGRGRQVDCIIDNRAYEIKIRITIAASGQGRWREELEFPRDCRASGFSPVLVVLDPTPNPKLEELRCAFIDQGGEAYIGQHAWNHLSAIAGPTMTQFINRYVHTPLQDIVNQTPLNLPDISLRVDGNTIIIEIDEEKLIIQRSTDFQINSEHNSLPEDADESGPIP